MFCGALAVCTLLCAGCRPVGPAYQRPAVEIPQAFKEPPPPGWKDASPSDNIGKGNWWEVFGDAQLNDLETQGMTGNQTLQAAAQRVLEARANLKIVRSHTTTSPRCNAGTMTSFTSCARAAEKRSNSAASVISRFFLSRRISRMRSEMAVPPGSRRKWTTEWAFLSRSTRMVAWVDLPEKSRPSKVMNIVVQHKNFHVVKQPGPLTILFLLNCSPASPLPSEII